MADKNPSRVIRKLVKPSFKSGESEQLRSNLDFGDFDEKDFDETDDEFKKRWEDSSPVNQAPKIKSSQVYSYKDVDGVLKKGILKPEHLENPNDPTDKDWDNAIDGWLNGIDPDLFEEGKGTILDGIVNDVEQNGGVGTFFDDSYPQGIPYKKVSDARKEYAKNKIQELVNSKYHWLKKFI